jgi:DNA-damage-inducible protein D
LQYEKYKNLYAKLIVPGIRRRKGLSTRQPTLDHMGRTEFAANRADHEVETKFRQPTKKLGGIMLERLPEQEYVKKVGRRPKSAE